MSFVKRLVTVALCFALTVGATSAAAAQPPIWIVRSRTATLVLFGSIHLLPPGLDWRPPALDAALSKADELWFEVPITALSEGEANSAAESRGALPQGRHLFSLVTPDQAERLRRVAIALHCDPGAIDQMQPWMAEFTLSVAEDASGGADAYNGVEEQVQATAPLTAKRMAFETAKQQIGFLAGAPRRDQIASLDWTLSQIDTDPDSYRRVVDEWLAGDTTALQRDALQPLKAISPKLYERLIVTRNRAWAKVLSARLQRGGALVAVVGVGHMVGPDSLPALLRARGFSVEGPGLPETPAVTREARKR
jgi:uncharacterized protein YbaP (TraB family)